MWNLLINTFIVCASLILIAFTVFVLSCVVKSIKDTNTK